MTDFKGESVNNILSESKKIVYGISDISFIVKFLKQKLLTCKVFAFYGPLGAGKTTIIRELLRSCGVQGPIASPTFTYMNYYTSFLENSLDPALNVANENLRNPKFYHFDLYRLNNLNDFFGAGFDEYLNDTQGASFVEWPEIIESILPSGSCKVKIDYDSDIEKRVLSIEIID
ncbi:MAG: hypothetical protein UR12_C0001G0042 [candidate division TM6 bacterium GW2011_GWF2_30_66]|jgi:tRNA threonylcarbamoyladenosine biosynthesis protein TsaE|nr:MAG: hypothetical protein UR12_C0001G0042 [candidate division TM6 bacterium GW2011_GWF2_30_66]